MTQNDGKIIVHVDTDLEDIIPGFLESRRDDIISIQKALEQGDYDTIKVLGHGMKGAGGGYGFDEITNIGSSLEQAAKEKNSEEIRKCVNKLSNYLERVEIVYENTENPMILVVDDNYDNLTLLATLLRKRGYEVVSAENGVDALEKLNKNTIDVIISDILMPVMDGFRFCRECKKDDSLMKIPFIFYTATYIDKNDEEFARNLGAEKLLIKPSEQDELLGTLKTIIEDQKNALPVTPKTSIEDEEVFLAEYNKRLVIKLEKKVYDLKIETDKRMSALGELTEGVCHEILNPTNIISEHIQLLLMEAGKGSKEEEDLKSVREEIERIVSITDGLLRFSRQKEYETREVDINSLIEEAISIVEPCMEPDKIKVVRGLEFSLPTIKANSDRLRQVFLNMITNAGDAMPDGGTITVSTKNIEKGNAPFVRIEIKDTGYGIEKDKLNVIFDPFYSTKDVDKGKGLGLSTSYGIIRNHRGVISVESEVGKGSTFIIDLPVKD